MNLNEKVRATSKVLAELGMTAGSKDCNKDNYKAYNKMIIKNRVSYCIRGELEGRKVFISYKGLAAVTQMLTLMLSQKMIEGDEGIMKRAVAGCLNSFKDQGCEVTTEMYFWEKETVKYM